MAETHVVSNQVRISHRDNLRKRRTNARVVEMMTELSERGRAQRIRSDGQSEASLLTSSSSQCAAVGAVALVFNNSAATRPSSSKLAAAIMGTEDGVVFGSERGVENWLYPKK